MRITVRACLPGFLAICMGYFLNYPAGFQQTTVGGLPRALPRPHEPAARAPRCNRTRRGTKAALGKARVSSGGVPTCLSKSGRVPAGWLRKQPTGGPGGLNPRWAGNKRHRAKLSLLSEPQGPETYTQLRPQDPIPRRGEPPGDSRFSEALGALEGSLVPCRLLAAFDKHVGTPPEPTPPHTTEHQHRRTPPNTTEHHRAPCTPHTAPAHRTTPPHTAQLPCTPHSAPTHRTTPRRTPHNSPAHRTTPPHTAQRTRTPHNAPAHTAQLPRTCDPDMHDLPHWRRPRKTAVRSKVL